MINESKIQENPIVHGGHEITVDLLKIYDTMYIIYVS